jgi:hypothetical protein
VAKFVPYGIEILKGRFVRTVVHQHAGIAVSNTDVRTSKPSVCTIIAVAISGACAVLT